MNVANKLVKLTHFIDPNNFYLFDSHRLEVIQCLKDLEKKNVTYFRLYEEAGRIHKPSKGELVGFYSKDSNRWLRCVVDEIHERKIAILWALDHGKPVATNQPEKLVPLPPNNPLCATPIIHAGLHVLPGEEYFNRQTNQTEMRFMEEWSDEAVKCFEKLLSEAVDIYFRPTTDIEDDEITFGELILEKESGKEIMVSQELLELKFAIEVPYEKFVNLFNITLSSSVERWNDSFRSGGVLVNPDFVIAGAIGETTFMNRRLLYDTRELEAAKEALDSTQKVVDWFGRNGNESPEPLPEFNPDPNRDLSQPIREFPKQESPLPSVKATSVISPSRSIEIPARGSLNGSFRSRARTLEVFPVSRPYEPYIDAVPAVEAAAPGPETSREAHCGEEAEFNDLSYESFLKEQEKKKAAEKEELRKENKLMNKFKKCLNLDQQEPQMEVNIEDYSMETWMCLEVGKDYFASISDFEGTESFFIQITDDSDGWDDMIEMMLNLKILEPLLKPKVGEMCLVEKDNDLNRAMIVRHSEWSTMVFCVDTGALFYFQNEIGRIYRIPDEIVNHMPFQAVHCQLTGIKTLPIHTWTNHIYYKVIKRICRARIHVLKEVQIRPEWAQLGLGKIRSYEVAVFQQGSKNEDINLNDVLVKYHLADKI